MKKVILVSVSGGKDSQAALNFVLENYPNTKIVPYFADTGWEDELTYEHIDYLENKLNIKIEIISSDKYDGFQEMCIKRKGFPTRQGRFCTIELKVIPSIKFIRKYQKDGYRVINVTGVRADESKSKKLKNTKIINGAKWRVQLARDIENKWKSTFLGSELPKSKKKIKEYYTQENSVTTMQPVVYWSAREVLSYNILRGTKNNPLYAQGYSRVGCMPCIMANTLEQGLINKEVVDKVRNLEASVASVSSLAADNAPTFFQNKDKDGVKRGIDHHHNKHKYNPLGLDLGCINQFGICE